MAAGKPRKPRRERLARREWSRIGLTRGAYRERGRQAEPHPVSPPAAPGEEALGGPLERVGRRGERIPAERGRERAVQVVVEEVDRPLVRRHACLPHARDDEGRSSTTGPPKADRRARGGEEALPRRSSSAGPWRGQGGASREPRPQTSCEESGAPPQCPVNWEGPGRSEAGRTRLQAASSRSGGAGALFPDATVSARRGVTQVTRGPRPAKTAQCVESQRSSRPWRGPARRKRSAAAASSSRIPGEPPRSSPRRTPSTHARGVAERTRRREPRSARDLQAFPRRTGRGRTARRRGGGGPGPIVRPGSAATVAPGPEPRVAVRRTVAADGGVAGVRERSRSPDGAPRGAGSRTRAGTGRALEAVSRTGIGPGAPLALQLRSERRGGRRAGAVGQEGEGEALSAGRGRERPARGRERAAVERRDGPVFTRCPRRARAAPVPSRAAARIPSTRARRRSSRDGQGRVRRSR